MTQITMMVWSLIWSQTSWNVKSGGPLETLLWTKLVEMMEFQLSYFKSYKKMLLMCFTHYATKFGNLISGHRTGKGQFSFQSQRKAMPKNIQITIMLRSLNIFFSFIFISWRLITLQYCSGFCIHWHESAMDLHVFPILISPSHLPPHPIPLGLPSAPALSTCLMHHSTETILKILQARLQQYVNQELPDVKLDLENLKNQRSNLQQLALLHWLC